MIAIMNLVYIIGFTLHIFNFEGGSKSANGGSYLLIDLDPRGSIPLVSTSGYGLGIKIYGGANQAKSTGTPALDVTAYQIMTLAIYNFS